MDLIMEFPNLSPEQQEMVLNGPAMPPPPDVTPNLDDPPNRNTMAIVVSVFCIVLVALAASARVYSRLVLLKRVRLEDYLAVAALGGYAGMAWAFYAQLRSGGFFVHQWNIRFRDLQDAVYAAVMLSIIYSITMLFSKTAILLEWIHIFVPKHTRNAFFWGSYVMMALNICLYTSGVVGDALSCIPLRSVWEPWVEAKCIDKKILHITSAYFNLFVDLFILLLPQNTIWRLNMTTSKKIGVAIIFSFGILTISCAAGRVYAQHGLSYVGGGDTNYSLASLYMWSFTEGTCVMLVLNIHAVPKIFVESTLWSQITSAFHSLREMSQGRSSGSQQPSSATNPASYSVMDDSHSQTELTERKLGRANQKYYPQDNSHIHGAVDRERSIVCHTEFDTSEHVADADPSLLHAAAYSRQHPWTE